MKLETAINKAKNNLIERAKKYGIWENFGQNEVRKIRDSFKYNDLIYGSIEDQKQAQKIDELDNWCMNYTGI